MSIFVTTAKKMVKALRFKVQAGPFKGLKYIIESEGSALGPKLLGTYEKELEEIMYEAMSKNLSRILDIGAAEGYYAVGLATFLPDAKVIAFEASSKGRSLLKQLAELNGVSSRLDLRGFCTTEEFVSVVAATPVDFVIMDIEGGEDALLTEETVAHLKSTTLLIEIHEFVVPGIGAKLRELLGESHTIVEVAATARSLADVPGILLRLIIQAFRLTGRDYLDEMRPDGMSWMYFAPRDCSVDRELACEK